MSEVSGTLSWSFLIFSERMIKMLNFVLNEVSTAEKCSGSSVCRYKRVSLYCLDETFIAVLAGVGVCWYLLLRNEVIQRA